MSLTRKLTGKMIANDKLVIQTMFVFSVPIAFSLSTYPLDMNVRLHVNLEGKYKNPFSLLI